MKELSRRQFLTGALGLGATLLVPEIGRAHESEAVEPIGLLKPPRSIANIENLALTCAKSMEDLVPYAPLLKVNDVDDFVEEFVPYLALIGYQEEENLVYPKITTEDFGDTDILKGFYLMGTSNCGNGGLYGEQKGDGSIKINERFFTEYSPMQRPERNWQVVQTLAHEISHSNQVSCEPSFSFFGDLRMVEGTTEIVAMNALFAMSMDGSRIALPAAVGQVMTMAKGYALARWQEEGHIEQYDVFLAKFPNHSEEQGEWNLWQSLGDVSGFVNAAESYSRRPLEVISDAMETANFETKPLPVPTGTLKLPHINYVLSNLSHFVEDYERAAS